MDCCVYFVAVGPSLVNLGSPASFGIADGIKMDFVVQRRGGTFTFSINGVLVHTHKSSEPITSLRLRPHRATMRIYDWRVTDEDFYPASPPPASAPPPPVTNLGNGQPCSSSSQCASRCCSYTIGGANTCEDDAWYRNCT